MVHQLEEKYVLVTWKDLALKYFFQIWYNALHMKLL